MNRACKPRGTLAGSFTVARGPNSWSWHPTRGALPHKNKRKKDGSDDKISNSTTNIQRHTQPRSRGPMFWFASDTAMWSHVAERIVSVLITAIRTVPSICCSAWWRRAGELSTLPISSELFNATGLWVRHPKVSVDRDRGETVSGKVPPLRLYYSLKISSLWTR